MAATTGRKKDGDIVDMTTIPHRPLLRTLPDAVSSKDGKFD